MSPLRETGFFYLNAFAQVCRHIVRVIGMQIQLGGNLLCGEIQPHEIQTQDPRAQRLMMAFKNRAG